MVPGRFGDNHLVVASVIPKWVCSLCNASPVACNRCRYPNKNHPIWDGAIFRENCVAGYRLVMFMRHVDGGIPDVDRMPMFLASLDER